MSDNEGFVRSISDATLEIIRETTGKMDTACLVVEAEAKKKCPVDQGVLRASITRETEADAHEIVGRIGSILEYAPYVHQGTGIYAADGDGRKTPWGYTVKAGKYKGFHWTKGQKPQPFLKNAVFSSRTKIERVLGG